MTEPNPEQILKRVKLTEKTAFLAEAKNVYKFEVPLDANKTQIRKAVEEAFGVKVESVNTQTRVGRAKRHKMNYGYTQAKKRALVKLHEEDRISLY